MNNDLNEKYEVCEEKVKKLSDVLSYIQAGLPETAACEKAGVNQKWFRLFLDVDIDANKPVGKINYLTRTANWQEQLLHDVTGEMFVPVENFEEGYEAALSYLSPRERDVIRLRYEDGQTLELIGKKYGLTRERIRQIAGKAIRRLRNQKPKYLLLYGKEYLSILENLNTAQMEYDLLREQKRAREEEDRKAQIERLRYTAEDLRKKVDWLKEELEKPVEESGDEARIQYLKKVRISEMGFSMRVTNSLTRFFLTEKGLEEPTALDLALLDPRTLVKIRGMGRKCADEIREKMALEYGVRMTLVGERDWKSLRNTRKLARAMRSA